VASDIAVTDDTVSAHCTWESTSRTGGQPSPLLDVRVVIYLRSEFGRSTVDRAIEHLRRRRDAEPPASTVDRYRATKRDAQVPGTDDADITVRTHDRVVVASVRSANAIAIMTAGLDPERADEPAQVLLDAFLADAGILTAMILGALR
jgi:hypothetical protein